MKRFSLREVFLLLVLFSIGSFCFGISFQPPVIANPLDFISDTHKICISGAILEGKSQEEILKECGFYADLRCASLGYLPLSLVDLRLRTRHPDDHDLNPGAKCQNMQDNEYSRLKNVMANEKQ